MFSDTMEKEQYRSVIRFLFLDGKTCEEIKTKLNAIYGNSSMTIYDYRQILVQRIHVVVRLFLMRSAQAA